jgi:hypothetical protein
MRIIYVSLLFSGDGYYVYGSGSGSTHCLAGMLPKEIMDRIAILQLTQFHDQIEGVGERLMNASWHVYVPDNFTWEDS